MSSVEGHEFHGMKENFVSLDTPWEEISASDEFKDLSPEKLAKAEAAWRAEQGVRCSRGGLPWFPFGFVGTVRSGD
jgi:hypothetical protein